MQILILEDMTKRMASFKKNIKIHDQQIAIYAASTVEEAKRHLQYKSFEIVFLDHDLDPWHYGATMREEGTGRELTKWLGEERGVCESNLLYVIHSLRPKAAKKMRQDIDLGEDRCKLMPYAWTLGGVSRSFEILKALRYKMK